MKTQESKLSRNLSWLSALQGLMLCLMFAQAIIGLILPRYEFIVDFYHFSSYVFIMWVAASTGVSIKYIKRKSIPLIVINILLYIVILIVNSNRSDHYSLSINEPPGLVILSLASALCYLYIFIWAQREYKLIWNKIKYDNSHFPRKPIKSRQETDANLPKNPDYTPAERLYVNYIDGYHKSVKERDHRYYYAGFTKVELPRVIQPHVYRAFTFHEFLDMLHNNANIRTSFATEEDYEAVKKSTYFDGDGIYKQVRL